MSSNQAIGIFDSGIGGLTVANAILKQLPNESLIYFGDTAHLPYGDKSEEAIQYYSKTIADFLLQKNCKIIVIACNTASSVAYNLLTQLHPTIPIINVIDPVVDYVIDKQYQQVGVIGTRGTIKSNVYKHKIEQRNQQISVKQLATPLLAPMIETGFINGQISELIIGEYLLKPKLENIESLILGCTHYPLIKNEIEQFYVKHSKQVEVLATHDIVGQYVKSVLTQLQLLNDDKSLASHQFYVSNYSETFAMTTRLFYGQDITLKEERLF